jgi:NDP-hexose-3-ketoreductase
MQPLKMGAIGCGAFARRAMLPGMVDCPDVDLVAVASRAEDKAREFAGLFHCEPVVGYSELLERDDIEAVYMPLPTGLHEEWVVKALEAGKHVLVEKSFAETRESAERMLEPARRKGLLVLENFLFPRHAQYAWVKDALARGEIGETLLFRSTFAFPHLSRDNIRYNRQLGGGALLDIGTYGLKASQLFLGDDLELLGAALRYDPEAGVDVSGDVMLRNPAGVVAQFSFGFGCFYQCNYELLGTEGKLTLDRAYSPPPGFRPHAILERQDFRQEITLPADNHYVNMCAYFAQAVRAGDDFDRLHGEMLRQAGYLEAIRKAGAP